MLLPILSSLGKSLAMKSFPLLLLGCIICLCACSQNKTKTIVNNKPAASEISVGGRCEDCELIYECPESFEELNATDTLPGFDGPGPKIGISGTIYRRDGKTPASNVILYVYHTDQQGIYPKKGNGKGQHGYIRGWIKTGADGKYTFYTLVPASYPNSRNPQHIHPIIKEEGKTAYWIDEFHFDSDPLLPDSERTRANPVAGGGVLKTTMKDGMLRATRDIILGLNVRDYPDK
jgi:protocatechuate 3,4-dioxygenase, beta subunit